MECLKNGKASQIAEGTFVDEPVAVLPNVTNVEERKGKNERKKKIKTLVADLSKWQKRISANF